MTSITIQQAIDLAIQHHRAGRFQEAEAVYRQILARQPNHPDALHLLGVIAGQMGRNGLAVDLIRQAVAAAPDKPEYHNNLGMFLQDQGQLDQAIACFQCAVKIKPDSADACNNLGNALWKKGRLDEAVANFQQALKIKPDFPLALNNLGNALADQGQLDQAVASYQRALALKPDYAEAYNNLGVAWSDKEQADQAIACFQRAIEIKPDYPDAYYNLGGMWKDRGQVDEAIACYRHALELNPRFVSAGDNLLFVLHYRPAVDSREIFIESQRWNRRHAEPLAQFIRPHGNDSNPDRRLRIGYVSPDFKEHSVAYFLEGLLQNHDRERVEIFCYANVRRPDQVTERFKMHAHHWRNIFYQDDEQAAEQIRRDGIDILVDLAGHTADNRLLVFARKPAPMQITYLGYPDITGLATIDYRLTDALADPPTGQRSEAEELFRLPRCFLCFSPPPAPPPASTQKGITFGSFNAHPKINPPLIGIWSQLLRQLPRSRLVLKNKSLADPFTRGRLLKSFAEHDILPDRIDLRARTSSLAEHLSLYHQIDIALDTFPYNGTTTTCEALWMGVPVIALAGQSHMSRVGVSILTSAGLPELIAATTDQYVQLAADLAANPSHLQTLRTTLRGRLQSSPLMDAHAFARAVESAYRDIWRKWCANPTR